MNVPGVTLRGDGARSPSSPQAAEDIWRAMDRTPGYLRGTDFERMFTLAAQNFASVYKCATGHKINPSYVAALPFDFLQAMAAVLEAARATGPASPLGNSGNTPDQDQRP